MIEAGVIRISSGGIERSEWLELRGINGERRWSVEVGRILGRGGGTSEERSLEDVSHGRRRRRRR